jgi:hypothetical protein
VGKATGWKAGRCRQVQISELFSMEICDKAVMDFLAVTDVGKFPPTRGMEVGGVYHLLFFCHAILVRDFC